MHNWVKAQRGTQGGTVSSYMCAVREGPFTIIEMQVGLPSSGRQKAFSHNMCRIAGVKENSECLLQCDNNTHR